MGDQEQLLVETPLQAVAHLQEATKNLQELVGELAASLWRKATDQEKHFPQQHFPAETEVLVPAVAEADRQKVHYTPVYLSNGSRILDVEGYVPKESILDTGASKVMLSKTFAAAMNITSQSLKKGAEFVTASGAVEMPLGITKTKLKFTLGRGTEHMCVVELEATVVDTKAYDVILGMEFVTAVMGAYDSYTEQFKYRWYNAEGQMQSYSISAPCHSKAPPLMAYAYFGGLISSATELQDVVGSDEDFLPLDDDFGFHTSPHQWRQGNSVRWPKHVRQRTW